MREDPSALWGAVMAVVGATLALVVAFGVELTEAQREAILGLGVALGPLVTALLIRRRAWKPSSVVEVAHEAARHGGLPARLLDTVNGR